MPNWESENTSQRALSRLCFFCCGRFPRAGSWYGCFGGQREMWGIGETRQASESAPDRMSHLSGDSGGTFLRLLGQLGGRSRCGLRNIYSVLALLCLSMHWTVSFLSLDSFLSSSIPLMIDITNIQKINQF